MEDAKMKYFAALDVSDKEAWVCVVNQDGTIIKEGPVPTEPDSIVSFLTATKLKLEHVGFEAGPLSPWLYHELLAAHVPVICLETRHAKAALRAQNGIFGNIFTLILLPFFYFRFGQKRK